MADEMGLLEGLVADTPDSEEMGAYTQLRAAVWDVARAVDGVRADVDALKVEPLPRYYDPKPRGTAATGATAPAAPDGVGAPHLLAAKKAEEEIDRLKADIVGLKEMLLNIIRQRDKALAEAGRLVGVLDKAEADVERWKEASGLQCGGDPEAVTPADLMAALHKRDHHECDLQINRDYHAEQAKRAEAEIERLKAIDNDRKDRLGGEKSPMQCDTLAFTVASLRIRPPTRIRSSPTGASCR